MLNQPTFFNIVEDYDIKVAIEAMLSSGYINGKKYTQYEINKLMNIDIDEIMQIANLNYKIYKKNNKF